MYKNVCESVNTFQSYHQIKSKFSSPDAFELEVFVSHSVNTIIQ